MILVEGEKYACIQCIRGHRLSTCQHTGRPLVQVRSRGRPTNLSTHRIAVFADRDSAKKDSHKVEKPCNRGCSCCPTKSLATDGRVIVVRPTRKSLVDVKGGAVKIVGPVGKPKLALSLFSLDPTFRFRETASKQAKKPRSCCEPRTLCCSLKDMRADFESNCGVINFGDSLSKSTSTDATAKNGISVVETTQPDLTGFEPSLDFEKYFELLHETCSCDESCMCALCIVHGNAPINFEFGGIPSVMLRNENGEVSLNVPNVLSFDVQTSQGPPQPVLSLEETPEEPERPETGENVLYDLIYANSCTIPGSCGCDDSCQCEGCAEHGNQ